jgi:small subunit ribosomal protein S16
MSDIYHTILHFFRKNLHIIFLKILIINKNNMALKIRLARGGSKKNPHYKIVVIESTKSRDGMYTEQVGHYHPQEHNEKRIVIDQEKFSKWLKNGALPTKTVIRLATLSNIDLPEKLKMQMNFIPNSTTDGKSKKELKAG